MGHKGAPLVREVWGEGLPRRDSNLTYYPCGVNSLVLSGPQSPHL